MRKRTITVVAGLAGAALATGGGIAWATSGGNERPLAGSELDRATAAALRHTGGGRVVEAETGEDGAAYELEVRLPDGRQVEVTLDASFDVVGQASDDDGASDKGESAED